MGKEVLQVAGVGIVVAVAAGARGSSLNELAEAEFGKFVQGASLPGGNGDNDSGTGDL